MRHSFRKIELLVVFATLVFVVFIFGRVLIGPLYLSYRFTPDESTTTIDQLKEELGVVLETHRIETRGAAYTLAIGPMVMWAAPSGPPMYLFGSDGRLLDYTYDVGGDQGFFRKWIHGTNFRNLQISIH
ncbi:MAG: hypothetical protein KZQ77_14660 [Candidatus Thiodiazotropha sp. (ex Notomyrtea botanica)]|nr:hypothetical protein [Candidatus Thiodiazotropha sp. (ex Notomyrtea botanica)]